MRGDAAGPCALDKSYLYAGRQRRAPARRRASSRTPRRRKRGNHRDLVPWLAGLLVLALAALLFTLAARFEEASSLAGDDTILPEATSGRVATVSTDVTPPSGATRAAQPGTLSVGKRVEVTGTGASQLRVRQSPRADAPLSRVVPDRTRLVVIGGPEQADGYTWWQVDDLGGLIGWAAEQYLVLVP